jgi:hypothetical protein
MVLEGILKQGAEGPWEGSRRDGRPLFSLCRSWYVRVKNYAYATMIRWIG